MADDEGVVMRVLDVSSGEDLTDPPQWIESFDVEAHNGRGDAELTADPEKALRFPTALAAMEAWQRVPKSRPVRDDGKPNRPLTAFTIEIGKLDD